MPSITTIKAHNANITNANAPRVALFIGATAGIAKAALILLVSKNMPMTIYVAGRDGERHEPYLTKGAKQGAALTTITTVARRTRFH